LLLDREPRVILAGSRGSRPDNMASSASIMAYMMMPGDDKVIAERLYAALSSPPKFDSLAPPTGEPASLAGQWELHLEFERGSATHSLYFEQQGGKLVGTHRGEYYSGDLNGTVAANTVHFQSSHAAEGTRLSYGFTGTVDGDTMAGKLDMGEYGAALWKAQRHQYRIGGRRRS
jgi:L-seryl-tRNA(Ser) seleniumtransferase